ncbi:protein phosphatase, putative [Ichthyophthirius multifiliis]|uniref:Protein phosphatase n=1 Tax=Ichthyophthirius multifiliis TaxID=5932 RepID=G0R1Z2_ICHMU|nr:protein phosphatase, putative [Ichthyophthirius multifiliis]EGR28517.1 protein phosphatase, putative [Ichthyophthirius multifiliis]|eukprot:XP_004029753.1 protein phosphatase, putative [Ichthyophthirius multifiliis]
MKLSIFKGHSKFVFLGLSTGGLGYYYYQQTQQKSNKYTKQDYSSSDNKSSQSLDSTQDSIKNVNQFLYSVSVRPHRLKLQKGGEDANYAEQNLIAVADGVGGWADNGVDPAEYSNLLIKNLREIYNTNKTKYIQNPKELLIDSAQKTNILGSSTLVMCTLDQNKDILNTTYIGDSGYCLYRFDEKGNIKLEHMFTEQQKSFNFPYQIGGKDHGDKPQTALKFEHKIKNNDVLIVGSDGLFDNLDNTQIQKQIQQAVLKNKKNIVNVQKLSSDIADEAQEKSLSKSYDSPFAQKARASKRFFYGGKEDDITVAVAQIALKDI